MRVQQDQVHFDQEPCISLSRSKRPSDTIEYLLVSSTSWTEDEDFSILLDALVKFDTAMRTREVESKGKCISILMIITGKGPLQKDYMAQISRMNLHFVRIKTAWLTPEDYPLLLGTLLNSLFIV